MMEPALTPEEWKEMRDRPIGLDWKDGDGVAEMGVRYIVRRRRYSEVDPEGVELQVASDPRHNDPHAPLGVWNHIPSELLQGAAALALYGQPFGFTWDDVDLLRRVVHESGAVDVPGAQEGIPSLADRIAALLPPRDE